MENYYIRDCHGAMRLAMTLERVCMCIVTLLLCCGCSAKVRNYKVEVVREYPHDETSFTQGLFFHEGQMYESTGQNGSSTFRKVDLATGKALKKIDFSQKYFVEGSVILGDKLYILTWRNRVAFVYNAETLEYEKTYSYQREGWGLTTDGKSLIASEGSSYLYYMDEKLAPQKKIQVKMNDRPLRYLNELEYIDGKIWANVYLTDMIVIINPKNGEVEGMIDASGLLPRKLHTSSTDVLNGIAQNPADGKIYLTGKNWPRLYEVKLVAE